MFALSIISLLKWINCCKNNQNYSNFRRKTTQTVIYFTLSIPYLWGFGVLGWRVSSCSARFGSKSSAKNFCQWKSLRVCSQRAVSSILSTSFSAALSQRPSKRLKRAAQKRSYKATKSAFFEIYKIFTLLHRSHLQKKVLNTVQNFQNCWFFVNFQYCCSKSTFFETFLMNISRKFTEFQYAWYSHWV